MIAWDRDPAASGWRSRAFLPDGWELLAYDDGRWEVRFKNDIVAHGWETGGEFAKRRVIIVHEALAQKLEPLLYVCHYCGAGTTQAPYAAGIDDPMKRRMVGFYYPACCLNCISKWGPLLLSSASPEVRKIVEYRWV